MQWIIDIVKEWVQLYFKGMILMWSGSIATIPTGWHLCDGTEGTPDLKERFIMGAHSVVPPGTNQADPHHTHTLTGDGHDHSFSEYYTVDPGTAQTVGKSSLPDVAANAISATTDGSGSSPPYYALAFIMKL